MHIPPDCFYDRNTRQKNTGFIEWRAISAANGYRVEIKSENKIIVETNVTENIYYVDLPKGKYEFRIGILNLFKNRLYGLTGIHSEL